MRSTHTRLENTKNVLQALLKFNLYVQQKQSYLYRCVFEFNVHFVKIRMPRSVLIERVNGSLKLKLEFGGCFHKLELGISAVAAVSAAQAIRVAIIRHGRVNLVRGIGQTDLERKMNKGSFTRPISEADVTLRTLFSDYF